MNSYTEKEAKLLIKGLMQEIIGVKSKFDLWKHIQNNRNEHINELNLAPAFFTIILHSLFNDVIITTAKLYEHGRDTINLNKLINIAESHKKIFVYSDGKEPLLNNYEIKEHRKKIEIKQEQLDNLFTWRDRVYAHNDKKYFFEKSQVTKDAKLTIENLNALIYDAWEMVNFYSLALEGKAWLLDSPDNLDVSKILSILKMYNKQRENEIDIFRIGMGLNPTKK